MPSPREVQLLRADAQQRQESISKRMSNGTAGGRSLTAAPATLRNDEPIRHLTLVEFEIPVFSTPEVPTVSESGCYEFKYDRVLVEVVARCRVAGSTASTIVVKRNGTTIATWNLGTGATRAPATVYKRFAADTDYLTAAVTAVGAGVKAITVFGRART